jgi:mannose-6-phosphate isomerase
MTSNQTNEIQLAPFYLMDNVIQDYPWGSKTAIRDFFDVSNSEDKPQAEIWMGAHPKASSSVVHNGEVISLCELIEQAPEVMLSKETYEKFHELPYLFKVLAAEKALSIQVHPSKEQAQEGFERENELGIDIAAANRNYKDPNHKPELVYALTEYSALNGFRGKQQIFDLLTCLHIGVIDEICTNGRDLDEESFIKHCFIEILSLFGEDKQNALDGLYHYSNKNTDQALFELIVELFSQYENDMGVFCPLMLNFIVLQPGEAMFLYAQTPHAYIKGLGIEVMANSDNVLRAGLTNKHIDIQELVSCTLFQAIAMDKIKMLPTSVDGINVYPIPVKDFQFSILNGAEHTELTMNSAEIIMAIDSGVELVNGDSCLVLEKGQSSFVPASTRSYSLSAKGRVARVCTQ